jgi:hypothetical protein
LSPETRDDASGYAGAHEKQFMQIRHLTPQGGIASVTLGIGVDRFIEDARRDTRAGVVASFSPA